MKTAEQNLKDLTQKIKTIPTQENFQDKETEKEVLDSWEAALN